MEYTLEVETGTRTITTKKEAKRIICATAMRFCSTKEELRNDEKIQDLAKAFDINTDEIIMKQTTNPNDFPFSFSFND